MVELAQRGPCERCTVITVDQASGRSAGPEPLRTLARFRGTEREAIFGAYFDVIVPGMLTAGAPVLAASS